MRHYGIVCVTTSIDNILVEPKRVKVYCRRSQEPRVHFTHPQNDTHKVASFCIDLSLFVRRIKCAWRVIVVLELIHKLPVWVVAIYEPILVLYIYVKCGETIDLVDFSYHRKRTSGSEVSQKKHT